MENNFKEPKFNTTHFTCPHCQAVSQMDFIIPSEMKQRIYANLQDIRAYILGENEQNRINAVKHIADIYEKFSNSFAICINCKKISIWVDEKMVYPKPRLTPPPNKDLPDDIKADYEEASLIVQDSPRGACALLRLALQKLMIHLEEDKNLDKAIKSLIDKKIINEDLQKALDSVRVIGNSAVHPNELDIKDNKEIAIALFKIINYISEKMLTDKNKVNEIYNILPETAKRENRKD
ncbi:DUF4145 domain-containing protein [Brachyspira aalborgi]|uniref:DUF4145 domain-containing protein n=1 Tax=Brachyspira aalborgi TaxID=29522 RepID=A0A5C8FH38_9SPIR|nr:DUF4145 domain-containing protein [Brachyspira aalborgi]TXJ49306.1 DUF4145 domain-containing protein [Brachyspira aalborgi]